MIERTSIPFPILFGQAPLNDGKFTRQSPKEIQFGTSIERKLKLSLNASVGDASQGEEPLYFSMSTLSWTTSHFERIRTLTHALPSKPPPYRCFAIYFYTTKFAIYFYTIYQEEYGEKIMQQIEVIHLISVAMGRVFLLV